MERESMSFDVLIVGAGPAGLSAAIRLAQLNKEQNQKLSICIIDKAAEIGGHILSGNVFDPKALNELIPDWQERNAPIKTPVKKDYFYLLNKKSKIRLPVFSKLNNHGNYIISLGKLCQWLAKQAESLGVNIFPGFAAHKYLLENNTVIGVQTNDMGLDKKGEPTNRFQAGINLLAKTTFFAEGCRGSLSEELMKHFNLRANCDPQSYGLGVKEVWKIKDTFHETGKVVHTVGWPLDQKTYGGSFLYHADNNLLYLGLVVGLDYQNPYLDPFKELQKLKTHPSFKSMFEGAECIAYGARALNEGGLQAIPQSEFPGGMLIGCAAGYLNVAKIKGAHTAMKSGILAAEKTHARHCERASTTDAIHTMSERSHGLLRASPSQRPARFAPRNNGWITDELKSVRNIRPAFHKGLFFGLAYSAFDQFICRGKAPWTFHYKPDYTQTKPASQFKQINYPKPDGKITFDKLTQVYLTASNHREDEPCHLILKDANKPMQLNYPTYAGLERFYCPAGVYEYTEKNGVFGLQIHAPNCIHCKTCDIKDPSQNIHWVTPEGGDGPNYNGM